MEKNVCHTFCNHIFPPSCKNARVNFTRIYPVFNENIPFFFSTEIKNKKRKGKFHPFRSKMGKKTKRERDLKSGSTVKFVFKIVFFFLIRIRWKQQNFKIKGFTDNYRIDHETRLTCIDNFTFRASSIFVFLKTFFVSFVINSICKLEITLIWVKSS